MGDHLTLDQRSTRSANSTLGAEPERAKEGPREETAGAAGSTRDESLTELTREVRITLQIILGAIDLLLDTPLTSEQREYAGYASRAAEDLKDAVVKTTTALKDSQHCHKEMPLRTSYNKRYVTS